MKTLLFLPLFLIIMSSFSLAEDYPVADQDCYNSPTVVGPTPRRGSCLGLVASASDVPWGKPRKILFYNDETAFVTDMGGWSPGNGKVWLLQMSQGQLQEATIVFRGGDRTHGLEWGPEGLVYYGDATRLYRFDPMNPANSREVVIQSLPDSFTDEDGTVHKKGGHPLTDFVFVRGGDLVVNVGSPSNDCEKEYNALDECGQRDAQAELRYFRRLVDGSYDQNYQVLARGLRNSMGLVYNSLLDELYQVENGADAKGTPDEMNLVELGSWNPEAPADYGWPFCYGNGNRYVSEEVSYMRFPGFCNNQAVRPHILIPAHAAPLEAMVYEGEMFPEMNQQIVLTYHGHNTNGSQLVVYPTDESGRPRTDVEPISWVQNWRGRPKGRPLGIATDSQGAIFILDDVHKALLVLAASDSEPPINDLEEAAIDLRSDQIVQWRDLFQGVVEQGQCASCHSEVVTSEALETFQLMVSEGWILPNTEASDQVFWQRISSDESGRSIMPPAMGELQNLLQRPDGELYLQRMRDFLESL